MHPLGGVEQLELPSIEEEPEGDETGDEEQRLYGVGENGLELIPSGRQRPRHEPAARPGREHGAARCHGIA